MSNEIRKRMIDVIKENKIDSLYGLSCYLDDLNDDDLIHEFYNNTSYYINFFHKLWMARKFPKRK